MKILNFIIVLFLFCSINILYAQCPIAVIDDILNCAGAQNEDPLLFSCIGNGGTLDETFKLTDLIEDVMILDQTDALTTPQKLIVYGSLTIDLDYTFAPNSVIIFRSDFDNAKFFLEEGLTIKGSKILYCIEEFLGFEISDIDVELNLESTYFQSFHGGVTFNTGMTISDLTIKDCVFDNVARLGIIDESQIGNITLEGSTFNSFITPALTQGFVLQNFNSIEITDCDFIDFHQPLIFENSSASLSWCYFENNKFGIVSQLNSDSRFLEIKNNDFSENYVDILIDKINLTCELNNFYKSDSFRSLAVQDRPAALVVRNFGYHILEINSNIIDLPTVDEFVLGISIERNFGPSKISHNTISGGYCSGIRLAKTQTSKIIYMEVSSYEHINSC